jgi:hypothetical protein
VRFFQTAAAAAQARPRVLAHLLVIDATGVGEPVVEMINGALNRARVRGGWAAVSITGGSAVTQAGDARWRVAKKHLASVLVTLFQGRRLRIAPGPETAVLVREAQNFHVKITQAGNETYESWRESEHDDLVLALALACWAAEYGVGRQ